MTQHSTSSVFPPLLPTLPRRRRSDFAWKKGMKEKCPVQEQRKPKNLCYFDPVHLFYLFGLDVTHDVRITFDLTIPCYFLNFLKSPVSSSQRQRKRS